MKVNKSEEFIFVVKNLVDTIDVYELIEKFKYLGFNIFIIFNCNSGKSVVSFPKEWGGEGETGYSFIKLKTGIVRNERLVSLHVDAQEDILGTFIDE